MSTPGVVQKLYEALPYCTHCKVHGHGTRYCGTINDVSQSQQTDNTFLETFILPGGEEPEPIDSFYD